VLGFAQQLPPSKVLGLATGFWVSQALYVAAKAGIADLLASGPKSVDMLAQSADLHPQSLHRVLRLLASFGVFTECEHGCFQNTEASKFLESGKSGSLRPFVIMLGEPECWRSWGELSHSLTTGKPAFDHVFGMPIFQYWSANPDRARIFDDAMASRSAAEIAALLSAYDFSEANHITDIGGGSGALLTAILDTSPHVEGKLFDLASVIERARAKSRSEHVRDRLKFESGDFFQAIPGGADIYLLKHIIHDWEDDQAREIFRRCRQGMARDSRLLLIETIITEGNSPSFAKLLDLHMLVWPGGLERTEEQYRALLESAGLSLSKRCRGSQHWATSNGGLW
jgi:O-methyltransferase domain/Dimerisation domain